MEIIDRSTAWVLLLADLAILLGIFWKAKKKERIALIVTAGIVNFPLLVVLAVIVSLVIAQQWL